MLYRKARPVTHADLLRRQAALGLVAVETPPVAVEESAPEPAPAPVQAPPGWPFVAPPAPETPPMPDAPKREEVGPGPGLPAGSVLGCAAAVWNPALKAYVRGHLAHWHWSERYGRYICSTCEPGLWATIPKVKLEGLR